MKKEDQICIIIPVYNCEKYITRCLESILNQSYKKIKIVIVDDCSTDHTADVLNKFLSNPMIYYIRNEQNQGVSMSRNTGLQYADSEYILFLDSDDWLDLNCFEKAIAKFQSDKSIDIVIWEIKTALHTMKICNRYQYFYCNTISNTMALSLLSHTFENEYFLSPLLGCKLFKSSLIHNNHLSFLNTFYEDDLFSFLSFCYARNIGLITGSNLYYYENAESLTHKLSEKQVTDLFVTFGHIYQFIKSNPSVNNTVYYNYLQKCISALLSRINSCVHDHLEVAHYKKLLFEGLYKYINMEEYFKYCNILEI